MNRTVPPIANPYPVWLANLGLFLSIAIFLIPLWEWLVVDILKDPAQIANYSFGSGSMLEKGGPHYANAALYAHTALMSALAGLPGILAFCWAVKRKTTPATWVAYACWLGAGWLGSFI